MKKFIFAATLWLASLTGAFANVPCSLPFTLANGTLADATQAMANYNAIVNCLNNAAAAGNNLDITSLGGLTTPLSPAQGGNSSVCGVSGFKAVSNSLSPNTALDITSVQSTTNSSGGSSLLRGPLSVTLNLGVNGINGLDAGGLVANASYYIWFIDNGTSLATLGSLSSTSPTLPGGYTYKCRVGSVVTDGASHVFKFVTQGRKTLLTGGVNLFVSNTTQGNCATPVYVASTTVSVPTTAAEIVGALSAVGVGNSVGVAASPTGPAVAQQNTTSGSYVPFSVPVLTVQTLYFCNSSNSNQIFAIGWVDNVNAD